MVINYSFRQQLKSQIIEYIKTYIKTMAKPFEWTYTGNPLTN